MREGKKRARRAKGRGVGGRPKLTRREWLARLGEAAAAWSLGGPRTESAPLPRVLQDLGRQGSATLPPGLYQPSLDCLTHALEDDGQYATIPAGTKTDYLRPLNGPYQPIFFTPAELTTVRRLIGIMLGGPPGGSRKSFKSFRQTCEEIAEWTDRTLAQAPAIREAARNLSPQHRTLAVRYFGEEAVSQLETADPQKTWRAGLNWLAAQARQQYGRSLSRADNAMLRRLLEQISDARQPDHLSGVHQDFFRLLKEAVIRGYYTSARGLRELDYKGNAFYASSPGCPETPSKLPASSHKS